MHVGIVGATGAVGQEMAAILAQRNFPASRLSFFASERSAGRSISYAGTSHTVAALSRDALRDVDIGLFAASAALSRGWARDAAAHGTIVIDNSSALRMEPDVPLIVPEINAAALAGHRGLIANPNCSTIIMLMALSPLHRLAAIERVIACTYQAVSGAGIEAMDELRTQSRAVLDGAPAAPRVFSHPCAFNVFSHDSAIDGSGFNEEERKMVEESRKILAAPNLAIAATCVRVPVLRAHTEALHVTCSRSVDLDAYRAALSAAPGVRLMDDRAANHFPMPSDVAGTDDVWVGRVRHDPTVPDRRGVALLVAGDQLRKGAALNAVQIAEKVLQSRA